MRPIYTEEDISQYFAQARVAGVVASWAKQGLFDRLAEGPKTLDELGGDRRALRITARILAHVGLLGRQGERWTLTSTARRLIDDGIIRGERLMKSLRDLSQLDELLAQGGPVRDAEGRSKGTTIGVQEDDPRGSRRFMEMLYRRSATSARETAAWIDRLMKGKGRVLDLGGGHGRYGQELRYLGHEVTLFDLPICVEIARERHGRALHYVEGDFFVDDLEGPYDAILASNIIHGLSPEQNQRLVQRCARALNPDGVLVLKDMFLDEFGSEPVNGVLFGLTMLMYTEAGDSYSVAEAQDWFGETGLTPLEPIVLQDYMLVAGRAAQA